MDKNTAAHVVAVKQLLAGHLNATEMPSSEEEIEFLSELRNWIAGNKIAITTNSQRIFDLIGERYPIAASRIAWPAIQEHRFLDVRSEFASASVHCDDLADAMKKKENIISQWFLDNAVSSHDLVNVVGDMFELKLQMEIATLLECYPILFVQPQHTYVLPDDGRWCLMGTIEGEVYFGKSINAVATGSVNLESFKESQQDR